MKKPLSSAETLQLTITPGTVYISTDSDHSSYANIVVKLHNNGTAPLSVNTVAIMLPAALAPAATLNSVNPVASAANLWSFGPSEIDTGEFDATPASGNYVNMNPGDTWLFTLQMVTLVSAITQASATVTAAVVFADGSTSTIPRLVDIAPAVQSIAFFHSDQANINPGEATTLKWNCDNIDYCIISPIDSKHRLASDSLEVAPTATTFYTLYAYAPGVILSAQWTIAVANPGIVEFGGIGGQTSVNYGENITVVWTCNQFTQSIGITDNKDVEVPDLNGGSNTPQQGSIALGPIIEPTAFTLNAYGYNVQNFDQQTSTININDIVCTFTASPDTGLWQQDKVTLTWDIQSVSFVSISPPLTNGPSLQNLSGSVDIYPEQDVTYVLIVSGFVKSAPVTTSYPVPLTVTPVQLTGFTISPVQIVPVAGGPNAATLNWTAQAQVLSIDNGIGDVTNQTSVALTAPADGTVYTLSAGTIQNPVLSTLPVTVQNAYGPFNGNITPLASLNLPIPPGPYQSAIEADLNYFAVFSVPVAYANLIPQTDYILEVDGVTGDSGVEYISFDPVLAQQLTPGRFGGYAYVYENTIYGQQVIVPFFVIVIKLENPVQSPATVKIITVTPVLSSL